MGIHDQHGCPVVGHHQLFDEHAGQVTLAGSGAGNDGQMGAGDRPQVNGNGHLTSRPAEKRANLSRAGLIHSSLAEDTGQHGIVGYIDGRAGARRQSGIDKIAQRRVVVAQDCDADFKQFVVVASVADHCRDLGRGYTGVGQKAVRKQADGAPPGDAA